MGLIRKGLVNSTKRNVVSILVLLSVSSCLEAQLQIGYYMQSCPMVEYVIKDAVRQAFFQDRGVAAGLVRLHFHDCFVRGCDGSVLLDSTPGNTAEKDSLANKNSLRGFEVIDNAKTRLEYMCPGVVSCADITAYAARDGVEMTGGMGYDVEAGRKDGRVSIATDTLTNLPSPSADVNSLTQLFSTKGFTQAEMVILSGAHTIGRAHCPTFSQRLYAFNAQTAQDPSICPLYAAQLKQICPPGMNVGGDIVVPMDPVSPTVSDTAYYRNILNNRVLFTSDQTLISDPGTAALVIRYAQNSFLWGRDFANAMVKMGQIDVLTGDQGEIRSNCRVIN